MTIQVARKLLGKASFRLNDQQIQEVIDCLSQIIEVGFQQFEQKYKLKKKGTCNGQPKVQ